MYTGLALSARIFPRADLPAVKGQLAITPLPFAGVRLAIAIRTFRGAGRFVGVMAGNVRSVNDARLRAKRNRIRQ